MSLWRVRFGAPAAAVARLLDALEEEGVGVSAYAADPNAPEPAEQPWIVELLYEEPPDPDELAARVAALAADLGVELDAPRIEPLPERDWLAAAAQTFPPVRVGPFFVHGSHVVDIPPDAIAIRIDAGLAFGSGDHPTTRGCLAALGELADHGFRPARLLDLGCGSGVLGIAAAKLWPDAEVLAADSDPRAVEVTTANAAENGVAEQLRAFTSDGFAEERLTRAGRYDLVLANILAEPLIALAPAVVGHMSREGRAVLAGLLERQASGVIQAYRRAGLHRVDQADRDGWSTLVLAP